MMALKGAKVLFGEKGKIRHENRSDFMSKRNTFKKTAAVALSIALLTGSSACGFFPTNNEKDLKQTDGLKYTGMNVDLTA